MSERSSGEYRANGGDHRSALAFWTIVITVLAVGAAGLVSACRESEPGRGDATSPPAAGVEHPRRATSAVWRDLAHCESRGNWDINSGNGFTGGLQFLDSTWLANGGGEFAPSAYLATPEQQIIVAERLRDHVGGFSHWPACAAALGLP